MYLKYFYIFKSATYVDYVLNFQLLAINTLKAYVILTNLAQLKSLIKMYEYSMNFELQLFI